MKWRESECKNHHRHSASEKWETIKQNLRSGHNENQIYARHNETSSARAVRASCSYTLFAYRLFAHKNHTIFFMSCSLTWRLPWRFRPIFHRCLFFHSFVDRNAVLWHIVFAFPVVSADESIWHASIHSLFPHSSMDMYPSHFSGSIVPELELFACQLMWFSYFSGYCQPLPRCDAKSVDGNWIITTKLDYSISAAHIRHTHSVLVLPRIWTRLEHGFHLQYHAICCIVCESHDAQHRAHAADALSNVSKIAPCMRYTACRSNDKNTKIIDRTMLGLLISQQHSRPYSHISLWLLLVGWLAAFHGPSSHTHAPPPNTMKTCIFTMASILNWFQSIDILKSRIETFFSLIIIVDNFCALVCFEPSDATATEARLLAEHRHNT